MFDFKKTLTEDNTEPNTAFLNQLRNKLPEFFTQDKYDFDDAGNKVLVEDGGFDVQKFQNSLRKHNVNEIVDGYTLNFVGKKYAELQTGKPTASVVIPDMDHNNQPNNDQSENVFLTGDNLEVLKHLQKSYTNGIDMIYIDPPYNTGSDGFVYNDKFDLSDEDLRDTFNMSEDEIKRLHLLNGRSSHSAWLTFMYPRLRIAQQLLTDKGVIFVSIDDNEQENLKLLMNEVFGEANNLATIVWDKNHSAQAGIFKVYHEYVLGYAKHINAISTPNSTDFESFEAGAVKKIDSRHPITEFTFPKGTRFDAPNGKELHGEWGGAEKIKIVSGRLISENGKTSEDVTLAAGFTQKNQMEKFFYGNEEVLDSRGQKITEFYLNSNGKAKVVKQRSVTTPPTIQRWGTQSSASTNFANLFQSEVSYFDSPKPIALVKDIVQWFTREKSIILDFFAGSATTADAVMQLNAEDGGNRTWILNTLDEKTPDDSAAYNAGYLTIDEIARERIKRSGEKIQIDHPGLDNFDTGFKHYYVKKIDTNTIDKIVDFDPNSIQILTEDVVSEFTGNEVRLGEYYEKSDKDKVNPKFAKIVDTGASGEDTILQTWLINDGYKLNVPVKTIELVHQNVHYVEDGAMAYIIDQFTQEDVEALLNLIGTQQLNVKTIIVFGYSFDFATMTSLKNNVKTALDGVRVEVRY